MYFYGLPKIEFKNKNRLLYGVIPLEKATGINKRKFVRLIIQKKKVKRSFY